MNAQFDRRWAADETRMSVLVSIGHRLPQDAFLEGLEQCPVPRK
jgi:hypothetical protein